MRSRILPIPLRLGKRDPARLDEISKFHNVTRNRMLRLLIPATHREITDETFEALRGKLIELLNESAEPIEADADVSLPVTN
jgi:hypothetical protein